MCHSEKAAVIALHHSKMFSQGKRNDILEQLEMLEKPLDTNENGTFHPLDEKSHSDKRVAEMYSLSKITVSRYLRLQHLIPTLLTQLDNGIFAFAPAVTLSHLNEAEQTAVADCIAKHSLSVDMKKADMLRKHSEKGRLDEDAIKRILSGSVAHKPNRTPTVKIQKAVYAKYFKPNQSTREIESIVEKALAMYFGNQ